MEKQYQADQVENKISQLWQDKNCFQPTVSDKKPFVVTLPPPNLTGSLHAGHVMMVIEDIAARFNRMKHRPTLFLPGFDHASIAVEHLVTQQIIKEGKNKKELGREEFLKRAHQFAEKSRFYIKKQLRQLGFSVDWSREAYTMSPDYSKAVITAFKHLQRKGLIYQGEKIINWCPQCQTVISDLENEHREESGRLYYIKYGPITIATTRPETIFADSAVAIHPDNKKYQKLVGKKLPLPLTDRQIPVIKDEAVDPEFGTGALKITPAHDELDFQISQRHNLAVLTVVDRFGKLTDLASEFAGMKVLEGRRAVVKELKEKDLLIKTETISHSVGHCQRCGAVIEPQISEQWFVKAKPLAKRAIKAVRQGEIEIIPKHFEKVYFHWLENIHDWCISRQLWWGHKIPVDGVDDILDTWFSSSLWPIATLGWPKKTIDFKKFYPTTLRETGYDILFFWVAREIMMCLELTDKVPFKTVYLHGLVRDKNGKKFSKTKKIGFDPLEIVEENGADALRMALVYGNGAGNDIVLSKDKVRAQRNFTNKIWNATRFILMKKNAIASMTAPEPVDFKPNKDDQAIIEQLNKTITRVTNHLENYRLGLAAEEVYQFFWHQFCDIYIEQTKDRLYGEDKKAQAQAYQTLLRVLKQSLKLLHPFMPFVTEEIWSNQLNEKIPLTVSSWPSGSHPLF